MTPLRERTIKAVQLRGLAEKAQGAVMGARHHDTRWGQANVCVACLRAPIWMS